MGKKNDMIQPADAVELPGKAEVSVRADETELTASSQDVERRVLHELQIGQIELELQNTELRQSRDEVESVLENYTELYDFAPVGYCTLHRDGAIQRINVIGAILLGEKRSKLINLRLSQFVSDNNTAFFDEMLATAFNGQQKKAHCEVVIHPRGLRSPTTVQIVAMASATADECLVVIIDITERKRLEAQTRAAELLALNSQLVQEIENRKKLEKTLLDSQKRLRNLTANLQSIREEERKAIAREIHDELGQLLASVQLGVSFLAGEYSNHQNLVAKTREMEIQIAEGIKTVQRISAELRPAMLDVLGLADALEWQSQDFQKRTAIECKINVLLLENRVHPDVATALFRIFQESLTNVQRHSQATRVEAQLVQRSRYYSLTVRDNGRGITSEEIASPQSIGLIGIRERVFIIGGSMRIFGSSEQGTALFVRAPVTPKETSYVTQENHHC
ncbi:sensor histidine kinase [Pelotalea chapellei]|uniref:histidine kinase n=1 Tax=Pelotalea chapellei TaxID=44671 RepID=A0ABS5U9N7_9BACT|nr:sensor histidine kinase [Pelotalea chapellei]MBT1072407.1 PAS domain S-box protein [Pelotalea chapellei]